MFISNCIKSFFLNLGHVRGNKNVRRWTTFGFTNEKKISDIFC